MDILIIGGGGREHALAWKISQSPRIKRLFASPGSDAIGELATCVSLNSHDAICDFVAKEGIDLTVIGPEAPLVQGLADDLIAKGHKVFGPTRAAAALEGSKAFSKAFMKRHKISSASFAAFTDPVKAEAHIKKTKAPYVVKADGLAAGKGVAICQDRKEARAAIRKMMIDGAYGDAGRKVVIEQFLQGQEASYFAICDGKNFIAFPAAQDHKPVGELDRGPNTGGMGAYCPAPLLTPTLQARVDKEVVRPTLKGMAEDGAPFQGVLYVGLMIDGDDIKVLEYNCRFGDPECQPLMMMLDSDLVDILDAAAEKRIDEITPRWRDGAAACIVLASKGYPGNPEIGDAITGLDSIEKSPNLQIFHAGTKLDKGDWRTDGGRVLGVTAWGNSLPEALREGYHAVGDIEWAGRHFRRDIGLKGLRTMRTGRPDNNVGILLSEQISCPTSNAVIDSLSELGIGHKMAAVLNNCAPKFINTFTADWESAGVEVFIAIASDRSPLPQVLSAGTRLPVIQVPLEPKDEADSSEEMNSPTGSVAAHVRNGTRAALFAAEILGLKYHDVSAALQEYRLKLELPEN